MKIAICSVPSRPDKVKNNYPPLGALAVMQSLGSAGYEPVFYDINLFRPSEDEMKEYFARNNFDVVGISSIVSTSYGFVKKLACIIKAVSPKTVIILGGRLAASSEVVLKFVPIDYCVIGEGENIILDLMRYVEHHQHDIIMEELKKIKGLCFTDRSGHSVFTGYAEQPSIEDIRDPDYGILKRFSNINDCIHDPFFYEQFKHDERSFEAHRNGKKLATVISARGCVNRCAFCHRWQRGIKIFQVDRVVAHIRYLMDNFNVGYISFGDENFGASRQWVEEFIGKIAPLDILYRVGGICTDDVDKDVLYRLKQSGCVAIHYGFESGCDRILTVMEKRSNIETNVKTAIWTREVGLQTVPAFVMGMPGESYETVKETSVFVNRITEGLPKPPVLSINALVTLPGTPVYEYARLIGAIGKTLADEEKYLLKISDRGGESMLQLNLTDYPCLIVQGWIRCITWAAHNNYYLKNRSWPGPRTIYGNAILFRMRYLVAPLWMIYKSLREDRRLFIKRCIELLAWPFRKKRFKEYVPLRTLINREYGILQADDIRQLRLGR
ncbi:MAG: radical SAM protein [Candidatus Omnitrophota bacterium]|jgi:radical SAM superfamily enzyme YgiQ (UPF0313 family)